MRSTDKLFNLDLHLETIVICDTLFMTLEEADKIRTIWGKYLEYCHGRFLTLFLSSIPESLLPYPREILEEALNIVAKHFHDTGNRKSSQLIQDSISNLLFYTCDRDALAHASQMLSNEKTRSRIETSINEFQTTWLGAQK